jgi:hypothetical protein
MMSRRLTIAVMIVVALAAATGSFAIFRGTAPPGGHHSSSNLSAWTEVSWPFPLDQWGGGKAFKCEPADCGSEVDLYLRAKLGFCNCTTGVADDEDLDRMSDFDLVGGGEVSPLAAGRAVRIGAMNGRDRAYAFTASKPPRKSAISVVFNDRCDMVVATVVLPHDRPTTIEPSVVEFLNSAPVLHWAEVSLGL